MGRLEQGPGGALFQHVPANAIQTIFYEAEPAELKAAKRHVLDGHLHHEQLHRRDLPDGQLAIQQSPRLFLPCPAVPA